MRPREAGLQQRTVIIEFDSYETALTAYESEAYKKALRALGSGAEGDFRIVEGAWSSVSLIDSFSTSINF